MSSKPSKAPKKAAKKASKGKRYSPAEKQEVLDFVNEVNASKGRGGQSAASKKFGISPLTIASWLKASGAPPKKKGKPGPKPGRKAKAGRKAASPAAAAAAGGSLEKKLDQLKSVAQQIDSTEKQLKELKSQFASLKASL